MVFLVIYGVIGYGVAGLFKGKADSSVLVLISLLISALVSSVLYKYRGIMKGWI
jgi:hypothetical protein